MPTALAQVGHYFFPQESNNQRAHVLHPAFLSAVVACFLAGQFFLNYFGLFFPRVLGYAANINPDRLIEQTNQQRTQRGLTPLNNNPVLNEAARRKAGDMFALNYWAHNSPTGRTPWAFFRDAGYDYSFAGENLARDFNDSDAVVVAWMDSPTHRDNVLNSNYQEIGIAVVDGMLEGVETTLVVQLFGTPVSSTATLAKASPGENKPVLANLNPSRPKPALAGGEATSSAWFSQLIAAADLKRDRGSKPLASPFSVTKILVIFAAGIIIGALVLDIYLVAKNRTVRLSGRSLAHLTFLLFLILAIMVIEPGLIL
ncbi:MAG TPA: CAP domain-containing protein [Candidatus Bathyarchaeia archaeon]|nr:CAP domain-containing protein [Candidatus Bathyarchaeia archaeon]